MKQSKKQMNPFYPIRLPIIFQASQDNYGTRKIKAKLHAQKDTGNKLDIKNIVNRKFSGHPHRNVVVSDIPYVRVGTTWHYICVLLNLFSREIIGYSICANKNAELVKQAFLRVPGNLKAIQIFHTYRGNEFKNKLIVEILEAFKLTRL